MFSSLYVTGGRLNGRRVLVWFLMGTFLVSLRKSPSTEIRDGCCRALAVVHRKQEPTWVWKSWAAANLLSCCSGQAELRCCSQHSPNLSRLGWICPLTSLQIFFFKVFLFLSENINYYEKQTLKYSASRSQARVLPSRPKAQPRRAACVCRGYLLAVFCLPGQPANSRSRLGARSRQGWVCLLNLPSVTGKYTPSPSSRTRWDVKSSVPKPVVRLYLGR